MDKWRVFYGSACLISVFSFLPVGVASQDECPSRILNIKDETEWWKLGCKNNWAKLKERLDYMEDGHIYVTTKTGKEELDRIRTEIDESKSSGNQRGLIHNIVQYGSSDENAELLKRVLALGLNPDQAQPSGYRPSHMCSDLGRVEHAKVLSSCRPNVNARYYRGHTPQRLAEIRGNSKVQEVWKKAQDNGFPSVAALAYKKKWYAVKNLCRRRVFTSDDAKKYNGKTAAEWARQYGENRLAEELEYYFPVPEKDSRKNIAANVTDDIPKNVRPSTNRPTEKTRPAQIPARNVQQPVKG